MKNTPDWMVARFKKANKIWLFLDYDGTLADFAPTPDHVQPDDEVIDLLSELAGHPRISLSIISGRRLAHVKTLVPVKGIWLVGTYGIEMQTPEGRLVERLPYEKVRPPLDKLKIAWQELLENRAVFYLEDKGWSLAIHAKDAREHEAEAVLSAAKQIASNTLKVEPFQLLGGHKFLEMGPLLADKSNTVEYLLRRNDDPGVLPLYLGDDDKDEVAFGVIKGQGGIAILVSQRIKDSKADLRLDNPSSARDWLWGLLEVLE